MRRNYKITYKLKDYKEPHNITILLFLLILLAGVLAVGFKWFNLFGVH